MASVTPPLEMNDARLTGCSISEPDTSTGEQEWSATPGTYAAGEKVIRAAVHWEWERAAGGTGSNPPPTVADTSNDDWLSVGPTNRWRALDLYDDTATSGPSPLTYEITPGKRINTIVLAGVVGDHVTITQSVGGDVVWTYEADLVSRDTTSWSEYVFGEFRQVDLVYRQDLHPLTVAVIGIEITRDTGPVSLGSLLVGTCTYIGEVEVRPEIDSLNFTDVTREFGRSKINRRRSVPKTSQQVWYDRGAANKLKRLKKDLDGVVAFWAGLEDELDVLFGSLALLGFYTRWNLVPGEGDTLVQQLEIEGN